MTLTEEIVVFLGMSLSVFTLMVAFIQLIPYIVK